MELGDSQVAKLLDRRSSRKGLTVPSPDRVRALIDKAAASRSPDWATMDHDGRPERVFGEASFAAPKWGDIHWKSRPDRQRSIWHTKALWSEKDPKHHRAGQSAWENTQCLY